MFSLYTKQQFLCCLWRSAVRFRVLAAVNGEEHARTFSRARNIFRSKNRIPSTKEEYRASILERARIRNEFVEQEKQKEQAQVESKASEAAAAIESNEEVDVEDAESTSDASVSSESEVEEEEVNLTEKELFSELLSHSELPPESKVQRYIPFVPSEDDDEYRPPAEESYVEQMFKKMEDVNEINAREARALYPEEEVVVQLVHFDDVEEEKGPVRLQLAKQEIQKPVNVLYLRQVRQVFSTKTKLLQRTDTEDHRILDQIEFQISVDPKLIQPLQEILDRHMNSSDAVFAKSLFDQIQNDTENALAYLERLSAMLPPSMDLVTLSSEMPNVLLVQHKDSLETGLMCAGALYPCLHLFDKSFRKGLCRVELLEETIRLGSVLNSVYRDISESEDMTLNDFRDKLKDANVIVPNFAKIVESSAASVSERSIADVILNPQLTINRIESCKGKIYNWADFNLYAYADFTLSTDETKFNRFCEMYNMTRKLQVDFAEDPQLGKHGTSPDVLYFWKQNWMHNEQYSHHRLPNGIVPHQFTSMYQSYEALELEGLTWTAFLKGLSILSEQTEVGIYEEIHFYEKLTRSRRRASPSRFLRDGLANVIRMMCHREQIRMEHDPQTSESPLFELSPISYENEIFA